MEDAVRPSEAAFKAMYERGYRTWTALWESAVADRDLPQTPLTSLFSSFPNHPYFPDGLAVNKSFSNTITARGKTTWITTQGACDLSTFEEDVVIQVASSYVTPISFVSNPHVAMKLATCFGSTSNHVAVLMLAWAYILSARWAELIPGARAPDYSNHGDWLNASNGLRGLANGNNSIVVDIGDVDEDAARWWTAVLSASGWDASIRSNTGFFLYAPWSVRIELGSTFLVSANVKPDSHVTHRCPASFSTAIHYLSEYCSLHDVADQSQEALAAALLIPVAKLDNRRIELPIPQLSHKSKTRQERNQATLAWNGEPGQLDRLLTLSCNSRGVKALLNSIFFEPDVACNDCGAWLQGSFAFLDSEEASDMYLRLNTFIKRDPGLGFLWIGAFITGAEASCLRDARIGWWKVDLSAAAWTGTHVSFIQDLIPKISTVTHQISRADECRLMYLSHEQDHTLPPLFPFAPFGFTALEDTDLDVRRHARCSAVHGLGCYTFTWDRDDCRTVVQGGNDMLKTTIRLKTGQPPGWNTTASVNYENLDLEDEVSEMVTRNVFTWLRGADGFPVAERAIREHEWIENLESDDDSLIEGDIRSTYGGNLGGWLLGLSVKRPDSI
ncbi:hypothetical protein BKA67DRAFT_652076 [Truncatella angustata]|uniref:Uncharacterized protein n=1 Tax=Truncatella angustata TaxID=152316 RepID=A0A9P8UAL3_9PEZI|nr:uncharacterized protein BKA67DRAFT_652076 [Truncatella angustata]KAH6638618.1 hypothetical protein BKA67DRAFT_652076 [Truncatella angustata]